MGADNGGDRTALLVLDVQNYFFQQSSRAYLKASAEILPRINELADRADRAGWPVVFTTHHAPSGHGNLMEEKWWHLPKGEECALYSGLRVPETAELIPKEHYSAFLSTDLEDILRCREIERVVLCGVMTHLCVDTTARHAFMLGWKPIVLADACCSKTALYHWAALLALRHGFAEITTSKRLQVALP
ncbi:MAG: cysteine hydrolase [Desulfomonile tiedjei]|nr:cysteine hydrolase [Desulfomonile tiedjei]